MKTTEIWDRLRKLSLREQEMRTVLSAMGSVIPAALVVLGAYMVIRMAIKTFKKGVG